MVGVLISQIVPEMRTSGFSVFGVLTGRITSILNPNSFKRRIVFLSASSRMTLFVSIFPSLVLEDLRNFLVFIKRLYHRGDVRENNPARERG